MVLLTSAFNIAQDTTQSLAFKGNLPHNRITLFYPATVLNDLWNIFNLNKAANAGEAPAQHELGIRYLTGQGVFTDTAKAAYWIKKAADQQLAPACYNFGILLNNGWGVPWNPTEAFRNFLFAAQNNMIDAQYAVSIFYTDNLVVERNWDLAYLWMKKAALGGSKPAKEVLPEIEKRTSKDLEKDSVTITANFDKLIKTHQEPKPAEHTSGSGLVFLDFNRDTTEAITTEKVWGEFVKFIKEINPSDTVYITDSLGHIDRKIFDIVDGFAKGGSPEALTLLARFYEEGIFAKKDDVTAIIYYLRALRMDSPYAPTLIWQMVSHKDYSKELKTRVDKNDATAKFAWASLFIIGLDFHIVKEDAVRLLQQAAAQNDLPALIELGLSYYNGSITFQDQTKAIETWYNAASLGSDEAYLRIIIAKILRNEESELNKEQLISSLHKLEKKGSATAQIAYGFCYERGIGTAANKVKAAKYFRSAAQRGSRFAYQELKRIYDVYKK